MSKRKEYTLGVLAIVFAIIITFVVNADSFSSFLNLQTAAIQQPQQYASGAYQLQVNIDASGTDKNHRKLRVQAFDTEGMKITEAKVRVALIPDDQSTQDLHGMKAEEFSVSSPAPGSWLSTIQLSADMPSQLFIEMDSKKFGHADLVLELDPASDNIKLTSATPQGKTHYTCPMHPSVNSPEAGQCPMCGMNLTPVTTPLDGVAHYTCPMHPSIKSADKSQCPLCGMDLVPVSHQDVASGSIIVDERRRQLIGVKTAEVTRGDLVDRLRLVGSVQYDPAITTSISLPLDGKIQEVFVHYENTRIKLGDPLFRYSSQALFEGETALVKALEQSNDPYSDYVLSIRSRLLAMGLSEADLAELIKTRKVVPIRTYLSPVEGILAEIHILDGSVFWFGDPLLLLADPNRLWVRAGAYENDMRYVHNDMDVEVSLPYISEKIFKGRISHISPQLRRSGHTADVYIEAEYQGPIVPANSYVDVYLNIDLPDQLLIPEQAVIHAGNSRIVFVDQGEGRLEPRKIRIGRRNSTHFQVLDGLKQGDVVVTTGNFLLASESKLKSGIDRW